MDCTIIKIKESIKLERNKNIFDKIGSLIPGYRGYANRDSRRNCDKLLRNKIADEILKNESLINVRLKKEVKNKNFDILQEIEEYRKSLNTLSEKVRYAPYGESTFFSDNQIKEDALQKIYQFDHKLFSLLNDSKDKLVEMSIQELDDYVTSISLLINERNSYIKEFK